MTDWEKKAIDTFFPDLYDKFAGKPEYQRFIKELVINTLVTHGFFKLTAEQRKEIAGAPDVKRIPYTLEHLTQSQIESLHAIMLQSAPTLALFYKLD